MLGRSSMMKDLPACRVDGGRFGARKVDRSIDCTTLSCWTVWEAVGKGYLLAACSSMASRLIDIFELGIWKPIERKVEVETDVG
jgi:hypothetical protein